MTSTADNNISTSYSRIQAQLYRTVGSILTCLGSVGAVLSCIVFAKKTMRKNPGSIYFIAYSVANLLIILLTLLPIVVATIIKFDLSLYSTPFCQIEFYLRLVLPVLSRNYLVLAAIDRTLVTSSNALTRQRSTHRLAYWSITGVTCLTVLFYIHLLVGVDIVQLYPDYYQCYYEPGNYRIFISYSNLLIAGIAPWFLLILFGILTLKNLHRVGIQPVNVSIAINSHRSKDRQLTIMLLSEILIYIICISPTPIFNIYQQITQYETKNAQQQAIEQCLLTAFFILTFINPAANFYVNLIVSKTFRQKTIELLCKQQRQHHFTHRRQSQKPTAVGIANLPTIQ